jgi:ArsR family transcriptional regulator
MAFIPALYMHLCAYMNLGVNEIIDLFKALSDETRLRILAIILTGEMCVCEIESSLGLSQSNASRHLATLKNAGFLSSRKCSQWTYYKMNEVFCEKNRLLIDYLTVKLQALPCYAQDNLRANDCKNSNMCD